MYSLSMCLQGSFRVVTLHRITGGADKQPWQLVCLLLVFLQVVFVDEEFFFVLAITLHASAKKTALISLRRYRFVYT